MASTAQHIAARSDPDLLARLVAAAEQTGIIPNAQVWAQQELGRLIAAPVAGGQTIADVHAAAAATRAAAVAELPLPPGLDPEAVTDVHLHAAIAVLLTPATDPTPPDNEGNPA